MSEFGILHDTYANLEGLLDDAMSAMEDAETLIREYTKDPANADDIGLLRITRHVEEVRTQVTWAQDEVQDYFTFRSEDGE